MAFVAGSFAALLLGLSFLDENLLEVPMAGRNLVWWLALTGILLTIRCEVFSEYSLRYVHVQYVCCLQVCALCCLSVSRLGSV